MICGALAIQRRHRGISTLKKRLRAGLPKSPERLLFSKLGRYALNGSTDESWYEETYQDIAILFSNFNKKLVASILSATSIRSHLKSNVAKAFKALDQLFKGENFSGFLDATKLYLEEIREGKMLTGEINGGARKIKKFANAMTDDDTAIVVDVWITRSFGCDTKRTFKGKFVSNSPADKTYTAIEWYLVTLGNLLDKKPRGLCASIWSGIRQEYDDSSTRYSEALQAKLYHGLFENQYGKLTFRQGKGIFFEEK